MMIRFRQVLEAAVAPLLVVAWVYSFYGALFCLWMLSHPLYTGVVWKWRLSYWLAVIVVITALIVVRFVRWVRRWRSETSQARP